MAYPLTPEAVVGGDPAMLREAGKAIERYGRRVNRRAGELRRHVDRTTQYWIGQAGTAYRKHADAQVIALQSISQRLWACAGVYELLSADLAVAHELAGRAITASAEIGMSESELLGGFGDLAAFLLRNPGAAGPALALRGAIAAARRLADEARNRFVTAVAAADQGEPAELSQRPNFGVPAAIQPIANPAGWLTVTLLGASGHPLVDRVFGIPQGGNPGNDSFFDHDWAGRAILAHLLAGGENWTIVDDQRWTSYMSENQTLSQSLERLLEREARRALDRYLAGDGADGSFDRVLGKFTVGNGEGIVGEDYLHGVNAYVGGFEYNGTTTVVPQADGTYRVTIDAGYTWNDIFDPNPVYKHDQPKFRWGELGTLGAADPFEVAITWHNRATVILDHSGSPQLEHTEPAPR